MKKQVLWDWNGTLLDDRDYCMGVRNRAFPPMGHRGVDSLEQYYREFTFPIRQYYANAGVTDEDFVEVAHAWMAEYERGFSTVPLHGDVRAVLEELSRAGVKQVILSATRLDMLREQVSSFGIEPYFDTMLGLGDIYAKSKEEIGKKYLAGCRISAEDSLMIGDSLHDAEVAAAMGTPCVLVSRGHQDEKTLKTAGVPVLGSLIEVLPMILE